MIDLKDVNQLMVQIEFCKLKRLIMRNKDNVLNLSS